MRLVSDNRASRILFNFLSSNSFEKPFIVPANVCEVIPSVYDEAGVEIVYSDVDSSSLCLDLRWVLKHINEYSGIIFVHTYGIEKSFDLYFRTIKELNPDFIIIDDRCLCVPSFIPPSAFVDLCLFSVGEKKQVDFGKGGFAFIQNKMPYDVCEIKTDSFLNDANWYLDVRSIEEKRENAIVHRNRINAIYHRLLPKEIQLNDVFQNWRFNILVNNKHSILEALFANGLFASSHYKPLTTASFNANWLHDHVINLFNDYHFSEAMAIEACSIINGLL